MDLTRYWRAQHQSNNIEVQWTGMRVTGGWILRLLIDGKLQAEQKSFKKDITLKGQGSDGPVDVYFQGGFFRNRCTMSSGGVVLADSSQMWNLFAFVVILSVVGLTAIVVLDFTKGFLAGYHR
jgi:hypothetical protein